jgi:hypothetical protein
VEVALIVLLCYLKAGWPPPDVNEAHYLAKAKHFWNPEWCAGDFFLDSADAHAPFYVVFGWVTLLVSLPAAAWIGRFATWILIAWAWQRLSWQLAPVRLAAVASAGLMIVLTTVGHMAGEWIIGGAEAKGFAFVLVFLGMEQLLRGRWNVTFLLLGGAAALHILVGGWAVVAAGIAWLLAGRERPPLRSIVPGLIGGFLLSLISLIPALLLSRGASAEVVTEANRIYVFDRLPHHLVFNQFPHLWMARHAALAVFFGLLVWMLWKSKLSPQVRALARFVAGAVMIAVIGIIIDQSTLYYDQIAAKLLRYYWYRLSDVMVPCGVALLLPAVCYVWREERRRAAAYAAAAIALAVLGPIVSWNLARQRHPVPGALLQSWSTAARSASEGLPPEDGDETGTLDQAVDHYRDWIAVCAWIKTHTPEDAIFLTPKGQQTFKWFAGRAEVVSLKDIPQDARGIVEWQRRKSDVFAPPVNREGYAALPAEKLRELANRYGAKYVIVDQLPRVPALRRVYPVGDEFNATFTVFAVDD